MENATKRLKEFAWGPQMEYMQAERWQSLEPRNNQELFIQAVWLMAV